MIIELYGLPGAGKTTMAKKLASLKGVKVVKIENLRELIYLNFLFLLKHPISFFALLYFVVVKSMSFKMFYYKFMNAFLYRNARYQKACRYKLAVIDEGHSQNILSIFEKPEKESAMRQLIRFLPKPDFLVIFNIEESLREQNIKGRSYKIRGEFGEKYMLRWFDSLKVNNKLFLRIIPVLSIDYIIVYTEEDIDKFYKRYS